MREVQPLEATSSDAHTFHDMERSLQAFLVASQENVHQALLNSFDTVTALSVMLDVINKTNTYIKEKAQLHTRVNGQLLLQIAKYLTKMLSVHLDNFVHLDRCIDAWMTGLWPGHEPDDGCILVHLDRGCSRFGQGRDRDAVRQGPLYLPGQYS